MDFIPSTPQIETLLKRSTAADATLLAREYLDDYCPWTAVAVCEAAMRLGFVDPALKVCLADAHFQAGRSLEAVAVLNEVLRDSPDHHAAQLLYARVLAELGQSMATRDALLRILGDYPDYPGALATLSTVTFPGPAYRAVIARLHSILRPATYLEIGVETGETLALASDARRVAGVDPHPEKMVVETPPHCRFYPMTSDQFFARETSDSVFEGHAPDLAFIDGMHWFEYVLRDFINVERWCTPHSTIVLHDCLPVAAVAAQRERASTFWVGDTWKALECLLEYRPDLRIRVVPTAPSGLVVVRDLDPNSTVLVANMNDILKRYRDVAYRHEPSTWSARYPMVGNDIQGLDDAAGE
jgi:tetratricopeptide (TPR) repeat protein